ncbi:ABC transporter permease [Halosquirtibacter xylanolyticus]|uniref:ABC transporter permease n=1 Tax=Halosquirtibacter xylanolyticus TaxID=3374599 RepID=UPI0037480506|nr:ABC transporter permease [Prolixibacteraceae bacterium]
MKNNNPIKKGFWGIVLREIDMIRQKNLLLWLSVFLPLISFFFFATLFYQGVATELPVVVVDRDGSTLSRKMMKMVDQTQSMHVAYRETTLLDAKKHLYEGNAYGILYVDETFSKDIYQGVAPKVVAYYNNSFLLPGGLVNKGFATVVKTFAAGLSIQSKMKKGMSEDQALVATVPLSLDTHILVNPTTNYFYYLVTALLPVMLQIFVVMCSVYAIGTEFRDRTSVAWLEQADGNMFVALMGKLTPYIVVFTVIGLFMNSLLFNYFKVPVAGSLMVLNIGLFVMILAGLSMGVLFLCLNPSLRMAMSFSSFYGAVAFSFSGLTFPFHSMPILASYMSKLWPFTSYLDLLMGQVFRGLPLYSTCLPIGLMLLFLFIPLLMQKRLKTICLNEKFWGRL